MIDFTPTDEQNMLVEAVHRYAETDLRRVAHDADEAAELPGAAIKKGWDLGLLPGLIPEEYGGYSEGQDAVTGVLALEELAWGDLAAALELWTPALFALPILYAGSEAQKQAYLPLFCDADRPHMTAALMEPSVTFDPWRPTTTATRNGDGTVTLAGAKAYVPLAAGAEAILVYARDSETGKVDGYIVPGNTEGMVVQEREALMGVHALPAYRLNLSDVRIPAESRLGGEAGTDYTVLLNRSRIALGALAVGVARAATEYAGDYAKERVQFGVPIASKQAVAFRIAKMAIEVDAMRVLVWEAAWQADQGCELTRDAALVKAYTGRAALFVADSGVQTLGGYGYIREYPAERWLRNARGFAAFEGLAIV